MERQVKGLNVVELVKLLKKVVRTQALEGLSSQTQELLEARIIPGAWYPMDFFLEVLVYVHERVWDGSEAAAWRMAERASRDILDGPYRGSIRKGDPIGSLEAQSRLWSRYFSFGALTAEKEAGGAKATVTGYSDMPMCHGVIIRHWGEKVVKEAGARAVTSEWLECPWKGHDQFVFRVEFSEG